ncbi:hypothetical protein B0H19DRAFT_1236144 [Mycena capillaripes]|nr:hypothetical protein B0H19DRAFT_1236144 [Mycena capillaripes]
MPAQLSSEVVSGIVSERLQVSPEPDDNNVGRKIYDMDTLQPLESWRGILSTVIIPEARVFGKQDDWPPTHDSTRQRRASSTPCTSKCKSTRGFLVELTSPTVQGPNPALRRASRRTVRRNTSPRRGARSSSADTRVNAAYVPSRSEHRDTSRMFGGLRELLLDVPGGGCDAVDVADEAHTACVGPWKKLLEVQAFFFDAGCLRDRWVKHKTRPRVHAHKSPRLNLDLDCYKYQSKLNTWST